jgi:hypothetical protein
MMFTDRADGRPRLIEMPVLRLDGGLGFGQAGRIDP